MDCLNANCSPLQASNYSLLENLNSTLLNEESLPTTFDQDAASSMTFGPSDVLESTLQLDVLETTVQSDTSVWFVRDHECQFNRSNLTCDAESKFFLFFIIYRQSPIFSLVTKNIF